MLFSSFSSLCFWYRSSSFCLTIFFRCFWRSRFFCVCFYSNTKDLSLCFTILVSTLSCQSTYYIVQLKTFFMTLLDILRRRLFWALRCLSVSSVLISQFLTASFPTTTFAALSRWFSVVWPSCSDLRLSTTHPVYILAHQNTNQRQA